MILLPPKESFGSSLGKAAGQGLGQGLSEGLQQLAADKLKKLNKETKKRELKAAYKWLPEESLDFLADQETKDLKEHLPMMAQEYQKQQNDATALKNQENMKAAQEVAGSQEPPQQITDASYTPEVINQLKEFINSAEAQNSYPPEQLKQAAAKLMALQNAVANQQQADPSQQAAPQPGVPTQQSAPQPEQMAQPAQAQPGGGSAEGWASYMNPQDKAGLKKEQFDYKKEQDKEKQDYKKSLDQEKQQVKIEEVNKKFSTPMNEVIKNGKDRYKLAQAALDAIKTGETPSGMEGFLPTSIASVLYDKAGPLDAIVAELANTKALKLRGPVGKAKIEASNREKIKPTWPIKEQKKKLEEEKEDASREILWESAFEDVLEQYGDIEPKNMEIHIRRRYKDLLNIPPRIPSDIEKNEEIVDRYGQIWKYTNKGLEKIRS